MAAIDATPSAQAIPQRLATIEMVRHAREREGQCARGFACRDRRREQCGEKRCAPDGLGEGRAPADGGAYVGERRLQLGTQRGASGIPQHAVERNAGREQCRHRAHDHGELLLHAPPRERVGQAPRDAAKAWR
jgi:hypothetical protein